MIDQFIISSTEEASVHTDEPTPNSCLSQVHYFWHYKSMSIHLHQFHCTKKYTCFFVMLFLRRTWWVIFGAAPFTCQKRIISQIMFWAVLSNSCHQETGLCDEEEVQQPRICPGGLLEGNVFHCISSHHSLDKKVLPYFLWKFIECAVTC